MGVLLHLVQQGGAWAGCGPAPSPLLAVPNVTAHLDQRPVYQLHNIRRGTIITFAL